eukprot:GFKZ01007068.1.p1 GENE.GFKZ01007068.1~~GFKZ01007068.1.p1  ORF type:complete len:243 (-),score=36.70 GFKZ01007068.1:673-1401(-)
MKASQEYVVNGANGEIAIVRFPTRLPEVDGIGGVVGRWEGDGGGSQDSGGSSSTEASQVALDATFCDEPIAFEQDDHFRRMRRDVNATAGVDLVDLELGDHHWVAAGMDSPMERKTKGIVRETRLADTGKREGGGAVRFEVMKTDSAGFGRKGGAKEKRKRRSDWSGLDESGSSLKSEERRRRSCGSFWMGVIRGVLPVVLVVWWCVGKRGQWDDRWLAYGTTVGLCLLIGAAIAVILVNLT